MKAVVAADERDGRAEEQALEDAEEEVEGVDIFPGVGPVVVVVDAEEHMGVEVASQHAHEVGHHGE